MGNSFLHRAHCSRISSGTGSSQSNLSSHSFCRRILAFTIVGEYQPNASKTLDTSDTRDLLVIHSTGGSAVTLMRKQSLEAFHSIQLLNHFPLFLLFSVLVYSYRTTPLPIAYNNSPTTDTFCIQDGGSLACIGSEILGNSDIGSTELNTSKVFAWDREVNIDYSIPTTRVRHANMFFYNIPSSGIGLPPVELFWGDINPLNPDVPLSHAIIGNQDLSQDDRTLRNVSLVVTTDRSSIPDYRYFRIRFTFPAGTSLIDWILLSEVQLCGGEAGMCVPCV